MQSTMEGIQPIIAFMFLVVPASYVIAIFAAYWVFQRTGLIDIATI